MKLTDDKQNARALSLLALMYLVWVLASIANLMPFQIDDAYITYRYVHNFLQEGVFAFNPGGVVAEGFSSQLWFWLLVLLAKLTGMDPSNSAPLLGIAILCATPLLLWILLRGRLGAWPVFLIIVVFLSLPSVAYYSVTGLEQLLFAVLVLLIGLHFAGYWQNQYLCFLLIMAAVWTRPEAPWLFVMLAIKAIYEKQVRVPLLLMAWTAFCLLTLYAYRISVFGDVFPNTYYAKYPQWQEGVEYIYSAIFKHPWFAALLVLAALGAVMGDRRNRLVFIFAVSWMVAAVLEGGDWMPMLRFLLPAMLLMTFALQGIVSGKEPVARMLLVLSIIVPVVLYSSHYFSGIHALNKRYHFSNQIMQSWAKAWFDNNGVSHVAAVDIGGMFYQRPYQVTDLIGLTDPEIAHMPGTYMARVIPAEMLLDRGVEVIVFRLASLPDTDATITAAQFDNDTEMKLFFDPQLLANYQLLMILPYPDQEVTSHFYGYLFMLRKDLPLSPDPLPVKNYRGFTMADYSRAVSFMDKQ